MWSPAGRPGFSAATGQSLRCVEVSRQSTIASAHLMAISAAFEYSLGKRVQLNLACCLQPIEFVAGGQVAGAAVKKITDTAGGLFTGTGGPKPPPALSSAVLGMKTGGKVHDAALAPCAMSTHRCIVIPAQHKIPDTDPGESALGNQL